VILKPPQLFHGQPAWASLLVLISYVAFGPLMNDPAVRIKRPKLAIRDLVLVLTFWATMFGFIVLYLHRVKEHTNLIGVSLAACIAAFITFSILRKSVVRILINTYQRRAPAQIRLLCKQTPCCSDYFLLSVERYGLVTGGCRGWRRIRHCDGSQCNDWP
jgi:putative component of membrane protein insertase Oxa1/YidC/SpoIIIJ protein YidD